ncbi:MAG: hypothetical protein WB711_14670 [Terriglobales bacterium]
MDEISRTPSSESATLDVGAWIGRVVIAVILAEAIWGFIVSVTNGLILPLLARTMGADAQSPLYLGKGDFNVPSLFTAVLELCFAGIAAVILNSFLQRKPRLTRSKTVRVSSIVSPIPTQPVAPPKSIVQPASPAPVVASVQAAVSVPVAPVVTVPVSTPVVSSPGPAQTAAAPTSPGQFWSPPEPSPQAKAAAPPPPSPPPKAKPAKPKPPKEIYYNIVGEPINPTEDD